jgi:hypothetical protein
MPLPEGFDRDRRFEMSDLISLASLGIAWYPLSYTVPSRVTYRLRVKHPANLNPERDARIHDASKRLELELVPQDRVCPVRYGRPTQ